MNAPAILAGLVHDMPDAEYHARPELSSTGARRILDSPARFQWEQTHRTASVAFDVGHAVHAKVLGAGARTVIYPAEHLTASGNPSTKAATVAWQDEQRAAGLVPIGRADDARVDAMAEAVLAHRLARAILEGSEREVSAFAVDPDTGVPVRARFDILRDDVAADLKTTSGSASPGGFGRDAAKYGYPIQEAWYLDALLWSTGLDVPFRFVVVEKAAPHLVAVHELDESVRITAREYTAKARHIYAECTATGEWPGYPVDVLTPHIPAWWFAAADDDLEGMTF